MESKLIRLLTSLKLLRLAIKAKYFIKNDPSSRNSLLKILPKQSVCAEVGVWEGEFSKRILKITKPNKLFLIDAWSTVNFIDKSNYQKTTNQKKLDSMFSNVTKTYSQYNNVEIKRGSSHEILESFPNSYFDWVYIDASHFYDDVLLDLEIAKKKVKPKGLIVGDDYVVLEKKWKNDVFRAVNDFAKKYDLKVDSLNKQFIIINSI